MYFRSWRKLVCQRPTQSSQSYPVKQKELLFFSLRCLGPPRHPGQSRHRSWSLQIQVLTKPNWIFHYRKIDRLNPKGGSLLILKNQVHFNSSPISKSLSPLPLRACCPNTASRKGRAWPLSAAERWTPTRLAANSHSGLCSTVTRNLVATVYSLQAICFGYFLSLSKRPSVWVGA